MNVLGPADVARLTPAAAVAALRAALADGLAVDADPPRGTVPVGGGELLVMASGQGAVKLVTIGGTPRVQGVVVVFDPDTLAPAALIDGIALTNLRTSAVSALAVSCLARPGAQRLLVFGRGPQAAAHVAALGLPLVDVVGREGAPDDVIAAADVICCCTTSRAPLFDGGLVHDGAVVVAIGSHEPEARETDDALAARATVVVESRAAALREAGDVIGAVASGALDGGTLVELAEVVRGRSLPPGPRLFKSVGMAWQDAVIARAIMAAQLH